MTHPQKQAQLKSQQDTLRQEVNLFLTQNKHEDAVRYYQRKCGCSVERAVAYVADLRKQRYDQRREEILSKSRRSFVYA